MAKGWVAFLSVFCVAGGVSAGFLAGIQVNPNTADRYVLNLGSVGEWFSGFGALAAVVTAIALAEKQRRDNSERIELSPEVRQLPSGAEINRSKSLAVDVVSVGNRPARLTGAKILCSDGTIRWRGFCCGPEGKGFPVNLNYGENTQVWIASGEVKDFLETFDGDFSGTKMIITTTLKSWNVDISEKLKQLKLERDNPPKSIFS